jgi:hypothetical protein
MIVSHKKEISLVKRWIIGLFLLLALIAAAYMIYGYLKREDFKNILIRNVGGLQKDLTFERVEALMGPDSRAITKRYGSDERLIILSTDPNLRRFLAGFHNDLERKYGGYDHGDGVGTMFENRIYNNVVGRWLVGVSEAQWNDLVNISYLVSKRGVTANIIKLEEGERSVIFLRPESPYNFTASAEQFVPYVADIEDIQPWGFFHEVTHARDTQLNERNYLDTREEFGQNLGLDGGILVGEAVADVAAAMIALKVTGNGDTFEYLIKPLRYSLLKDSTHQTQFIASAAMKEVVFTDVKDRSDTELMALAQQKVESVVRSDLKSYDQDVCPIFGNSVNEFLRGLRGGCVERNSYQMLSGVRAIESSIQHLVYQSKVLEGEDELMASIHNHLNDYDDHKMQQAFYNSLNSSGRRFDIKKFSDLMGFAVDWHSSERRLVNNTKLRNYYLEQTNNRQGFEVSTSPERQWFPTN